MGKKLQASWNLPKTNAGRIKIEKNAKRMAKSRQRISNQFNCGRPGCEVDIASLPHPQLRRSVAQIFKRATGSFVCTQCGQVSQRDFFY